MPSSTDWIQPFLTALRYCAVVSVAARRVGVAPASVYARRKADADFDAAVAEALEEATDIAEAEMMRRAVEGVDEPVVYQGNLTYLRDPEQPPDPVTGLCPPLLDAHGRPRVLTVNKRSDALLMFALRGRRAAYRTERTEHTGADGAPLMPAMTDIERAARVAALVDIAQRRRAVDDEDMT